MASPLLHLRRALFEIGSSEPVTYTPPATVAVPSPEGVTVRAVRSGDLAGQLSGAGNPLTGITFELARDALSARPVQNGTITDADGTAFRITQVAERDFTGSFTLTVVFA